MADTAAQQRSAGTGSNTGGAAFQRGPNDPDGSIYAEAMRRANEAWAAERNNVAEGRDCQRFYAGDQWDVAAKNDRLKDRRPTLTVNRLPQFVRQVTGDIRKNPPALRCLPAGGKASRQVAEAYSGIIRNIEQQSNAKDCYVKALENAVQASQGAVRVLTEYSSDDSFDLDIRIRPILDPFGVLIDPFATLLDKSDMKYAYVMEHMTTKDFKAMYPKASPVSVPNGPEGALIFPWRINDTIRIAEYWRRIPVKKTLYQLADGSIVEELPPGQKPVQEREVEAFAVEMYKMTGAQILSGPHAWPGRYIPIIPVVGEEISMDGSTTRKGMVHDLRDPQRIYNYSRSASVEAVSLQPKSPFIGTVDMFKGRPEWATAASKNHAYLAYNPDPKAPGGRPERSQPPIASQGLDVQAAVASDDMKAVSGIYDASLGARSNEQSGIAIQSRQREGDTATYYFPDNLNRALGYLGRVLVDLIPRVYDTERQIRILREDGTAEMVTVNGPPQINMKTGEPFHELYDLSAGEYDVVVTTGPSFATQRAETLANMVQLIQADPSLIQKAGDLIVDGMDFPKAAEIAKRLRMAAGIPEEGEPPPPPPPPNPKDVAQALQYAAQADKTKAEAQGVEMQNVQMAMQLQAIVPNIAQMVVGELQRMLAGGAPMGGPMGGALPAPGPMPAPPPAPDMAGGMPPMMEMGEEPPMVELSELEGGAPV